MKRLCGIAILLLASSASLADVKPLAKGVWKVLVKPGARWVLKGKTLFEETMSVVVETYDVRKIGDAEVARLRWTKVAGDKKEDIGTSEWGRYTQVAVTDAGLYLLDKDMDDAKVAEALKRKPARSDPPKPYKATPKNDGRYLRYSESPGGTVVCMGIEPPAGEDVDCEDVCYGEVCVHPTAGVVTLEGKYAPDEGLFAQAKFTKTSK
jgi:hypothetical protein